MDALLRLEHVEKAFGRIRAVDGISLAVRPGELVAVVGANGAGKTTLLRMAIGMLGPDGGRVRYRLGGRESGTVDRGRIGYLPEERGLYTDVPVMRSLLYFAALRGMPRAEARVEASRWLERLGLADRADEEVRALSKGNQQKVQFISSVVHRPELAVLDEPFSGLDPLNQDFFLDLIRELRAAGTTVLFSAHQMQLVERLADRVILMRDGRLATEGTLPELRDRWGAGRSLRLRLADDIDAAELEALPDVRAVRHSPEGEVLVDLTPEGTCEAVFRAVASAGVVAVSTEAVTLHDIYVRTVGAEGEGTDAGTDADAGTGAAEVLEG